jgi:tetratricopeptide (TPR) repeat protein
MNLSSLAIQKAINNEWQDAIEINTKILEQDPRDISALNRIAQAYFNLCQLPKAKKYYQQVLDIDHYNPIAKRNLEKLGSLIKNGKTEAPNQSKSFNFIEEPRKTKIISLVRLGERTVISNLQPCSELDLVIRSQSISLYCNKKYVGRLPDDISKRLIWLSKRNNKYNAVVKSAEKNHVSVFIKEIKQSLKNKDLSSF